MKERLPAVILRMISVLTAVAGVLICIFALPPFGMAVAKNFPDYSFWQYPILIGLYAGAICFFYALVHFWLLLNGLDRDGHLSLKRLAMIRVSSIVFAILYFVFVMPIIFLAAEGDDAPGLILVGAFLRYSP